jgi:hypothetical protein
MRVSSISHRLDLQSLALDLSGADVVRVRDAQTGATDLSLAQSSAIHVVYRYRHQSELQICLAFKPVGALEF